MLTIDEINKALREVDPEAFVEFMFQDEIAVACSEEHTDAVNQRLGELLSESLREAETSRLVRLAEGTD